ncbi:hypothetical protein HY628_00875 [Candidatus Uhrbacteria bacterium]|nr:hypothetical protein [Candidatus Uhrbacteria bacterium]
MLPASRKLGIDFGGVIRRATSDDESEETVDGWSFRKTPPVAGAFEGIRCLVQEVFGTRIWIVSRCRSDVTRWIRVWFREKGFFAFTGVPPDHFLTCRERPHKAVLCRDLGLTDFVDNRLEVLLHMAGQVPHLYLFDPDTREMNLFSEASVSIRRIEDWRSLVGAIRASAK